MPTLVAVQKGRVTHQSLMVAHAHLAAAAAAASAQGHPFGPGGASQPAAAAAAAMAAMALQQNPMLAQHPAAAGMFAHLSAMHPALRGHPMAFIAAAALHQHHQQQQQQHQPRVDAPNGNLVSTSKQTGPNQTGLGHPNLQARPKSMADIQQQSMPVFQQQQQGPLGPAPMAPTMTIGSPVQLGGGGSGQSFENQHQQQQQLANFQQQLNQQLQLAAAMQHYQQQQQHQINLVSNQNGSPNSSKSSLVRPWEM